MSRKTRVAPAPIIPGERCPNCKEERKPPVCVYTWEATWVDAPHENVFDCVRHLASVIIPLEEEVKSLTTKLEELENRCPRNDRDYC